MMTRRSMITRLAALGLVGPALGTVFAEEKKIRVLLLSGDNNHDWKTTTPCLKKILEDSGRFAVDVTEKPETMTPDLLAPYDLVLSNWTNYPERNRIWGETAENALFDFVKTGKGFVLFHAGAATFPDWPVFGDFVGAGWVPREPNRPNYGSGHGARHTFKVVIADKAHPVTQGLSDFYHNDELWHRLALRPDAAVLAKAFSAKDKNGTGQDEPMVIARSHGKGRVFFLVPGHDTVAMGSPAWKTLMLRGAEWAATAKATIAPLEPWPSKPEDAAAPAPKAAKPK